MSRLAYLMVCFLLLSTSVAQQDSLRMFRLSGFQMDISPGMNPEFENQDQADYRQYVRNDQNLNADLSRYKLQSAYFYQVFEGALATKFYADLNLGTMKKELFIGMRYCQEFNTGAYYTRSDYDTLGIFTDNNGTRLYQVLVTESMYNYSIYSQKIMVPLGINFTTNKKKFFWITWGFELAPALNFNYMFRSIHSESYEERFMHEGESFTNHNYTGSLFNRQSTWTNHKTSLGGVGLGFSVALPFTFYVHPFPKVLFLKHLNVLAGISPTYLYTYSPYSGNAYFANIILSTGIRYNW